MHIAGIRSTWLSRRGFWVILPEARLGRKVEEAGRSLRNVHSTAAYYKCTWGEMYVG